MRVSDHGQATVRMVEPPDVDRELDRVRVLELVDKDVVELAQNRCLPILESLLNGREVENAVPVEVSLPPTLELHKRCR